MDTVDALASTGSLRFVPLTFLLDKFCYGSLIGLVSFTVGTARLKNLPVRQHCVPELCARIADTRCCPTRRS